ncbi:type III pantothenate kinase [Kordiimonas marina]|uniref:type III pantothenate kinase n=1 Tax=Kordiimonas marina TaxID=2872312 RepID=UPI001FF12436|nr:type III pantothenate kinase [Kordiimonas marina]MCJ9428740.1 type III pantothenate kinase [Kordiimonas marina]
MLLTIDAGNTNTVFALIDGEDIVEQWRISTGDQRTVDEYMVWISHLMALHDRKPEAVTGAIIASVVPQMLWPLTQLCKKYFHCDPLIVGAPEVKLGVDVDVKNPQEVGADRLVNAVAADALYGGPVAVVDFGTATTFDIVGKNGAYLGGVICPGINLSLHALHQAAAKLPRIAVAPPTSDRVTGKSTLEAMQAGIFWGYVGMIEGITARLKKEHGADMKVLATGGLAPVFAGHTDAIDAVAGDLTLQGLRLIYERNQ